MLKLYITVGGSTFDYTQAIDFASLTMSEQHISLPAEMSFNLRPINQNIVTPPARAYVELYSTAAGRNIFTGFVASTPNKKYLGVGMTVPNMGRQMFDNVVNCVSDELLLNIKSIPFIPAFVNQTQGQILGSLANILASGFYDVESMMASGDLVPYFEYDPSLSWTQVGKAFADGSRYRLKVRDRIIQYVPIGDGPLGIKYDETQPSSQFNAQALNTDTMEMPIVNDVTVIGDIEAGNNREDYFVGDGFTGTFPLTHQMFRGGSAILLQESWNGTGLPAQSWDLSDPGNNFDFSIGALNVDSALTFTLGESYLAMRNGLEIAGGLNLQHGEFLFNDECEGVLGGMYATPTYDESQLLGGFMLSSTGTIIPSASGAAGIEIIPWFNGAAVAPAIVTEQNHTYVLQTLIHAPAYSRYTRAYRTTQGIQYGGLLNESLASVTFIIQDYDVSLAGNPGYAPDITQVTVDGATLTPFIVYALVNQVKMNLTASNTLIAAMPLGGLTALVGSGGLAVPSGLALPLLPSSLEPFQGVPDWPGAASGTLYARPLPLIATQQQYVLGNGFQMQAAQITPGNSADMLQFYSDTIPTAGARIRLQSWESQAATSRIQASGSIVHEAFVVGDDGIRSAIVPNLNPLPRTSEDCDNAALAFLQDRTRDLYVGSYKATSVFFTPLTSDVQYFPTVGRYLPINAPHRGIDGQQYLVVGLTMRVLDAVSELLEWDLQFGADLMLEKVLHNFVDTAPVSVLTPKDKANPPLARTIEVALETYLPDLNNVQIDMTQANSVTLTVNVFDNYFGPIEVRRVDSNWGLPTSDLIATVTGPQFQITRQQYDQTFYLRGVNNGRYSRRSKVLRVRWPLPPSPPLFTSQQGSQIQLDFNGDQRNIYGIEVRTQVSNVVVYQRPVASLADLFFDLTATPFVLDPSYGDQRWALQARFFNTLWEYSSPLLLDLANGSFDDLTTIGYVPV